MDGLSDRGSIPLSSIDGRDSEHGSVFRVFIFFLCLQMSAQQVQKPLSRLIMHIRKKILENRISFRFFVA